MMGLTALLLLLLSQVAAVDCVRPRVHLGQEDEVVKLRHRTEETPSSKKLARSSR